MNFCKKNIMHLDFFGEEFKFNIEGEGSVKTGIGGILGLLCIGLMIGATWTLGKDILYKEKPQLTIQEYLYDRRPNITLDRYSYPISIAFQRAPDNKVFNDPRYFKYVVQKVTVNNTNAEMTTESYDIEACREDHFPNFNL